jgi:predicted dienelactone hydrolase
VTVPVQVWRAGDDAILPSPLYVEPVAAALPSAPEMHVVPHAGHFDFLAPCSPALAQVARDICTSEPGFDRAAFHRAFNRDVVAFFVRTLHAGGR